MDTKDIIDIIDIIKNKKRYELNILLKQDNRYAKNLIHAYNLYLKHPNDYTCEAYLDITYNETRKLLGEKYK